MIGYWVFKECLECLECGVSGVSRVSGHVQCVQSVRSVRALSVFVFTHLYDWVLGIQRVTGVSGVSEHVQSVRSVQLYLSVFMMKRVSEVSELCQFLCLSICMIGY